MARFNPPPSWPRPPDGWEPPVDWTPDPAWGPPPPGWQLWIDDGTASAPGPSTTASASKSLLTTIAVVAAVIALVITTGVAYWGYSTWRANQVVAKMFNPSETSNLRGTWTGNNKGECDITLTVTSSTRLNGTINYCDLCKESWTETSRSYSIIYVEEKVLTGKGCTGVEWKISVEGNTMTGTKNWESGSGSTDKLLLHKTT